MLPSVEEQLLGLREHLVRVGRGRGAGGREQGGRVDCTLLATQKFTERLAIEGPRRGQELDQQEVTEEQRGSEDTAPLLAPSRAALTRLVAAKRAEHSALSARADSGSSGREQSWRPRGQLVAHLAEHQGGVTRLAAVPDTTLFASTGVDGALRLWDCAKMEGRALANKARLVHQRGVPLDCLAASGQPQVGTAGTGPAPTVATAGAGHRRQGRQSAAVEPRERRGGGQQAGGSPGGGRPGGAGLPAALLLPPPAVQHGLRSSGGLGPQAAGGSVQVD